jgi:hypothetical protein
MQGRRRAVTLQSCRSAQAAAKDGVTERRLEPRTRCETYGPRRVQRLHPEGEAVQTCKRIPRTKRSMQQR